MIFIDDGSRIHRDETTDSIRMTELIDRYIPNNTGQASSRQRRVITCTDNDDDEDDGGDDDNSDDGEGGNYRRSNYSRDRRDANDNKSIRDSTINKSIKSRSNRVDESRDNNIIMNRSSTNIDQSIHRSSYSGDSKSIVDNPSDNSSNYDALNTSNTTATTTTRQQVKHKHHHYNPHDVVRGGDSSDNHHDDNHTSDNHNKDMVVKIRNRKHVRDMFAKYLHDTRYDRHMSPSLQRLQSYLDSSPYRDSNNHHQHDSHDDHHSSNHRSSSGGGNHTKPPWKPLNTSKPTCKQSSSKNNILINNGNDEVDVDHSHS